MRILSQWLLRALIIFATAYVVPGFHINSFIAAIVLVIILGALNLFIRPILLLLTLPINVLTLGLFTFVINAMLLKLGSVFVVGVQIESFLTALIAAVVISFLSSVADVFFS